MEKIKNKTKEIISSIKRILNKYNKDNKNRVDVIIENNKEKSVTKQKNKFSKIIERVMLILSKCAIWKYNWFKKIFRKWFGHLILISAIIAIFIVINLIVPKIPLKTIDLTSNKEYSLTKTSIDYIKNIKEDIDIYIFTLDNTNFEVKNIRKFLNEYSANNKKINIKEINPDNELELTKKYDINITYGGESGTEKLIDGGTCTIVFVKGDKNKKIPGYTISDQQGIYEQTFTNAIIEVLSAKTEKIYYLSGYSNSTLNTTNAGLVYYLQKEIFSIEDINIKTIEKIPEDATIVILPTVDRDLLQEDADKILNYYNQGGKIVALQDYNETNIPVYENMISDLGVSITKQKISEGDTNRRSPNNKEIILPTYSGHEINARVKEKNIDIIFFGAMPINILDKKEGNEVVVNPILTTSDKAYTLDKKQTFNIGTISTKKIDDIKSGEFVLYTNYSFINDKVLVNNGLNNIEIMFDTFKYLSKRTDIIKVDKTNVTLIEYKIVSETQKWIVYGIIIVIPIIIMVIGIYVVVNRKVK